MNSTTFKAFVVASLFVYFGCYGMESTSHPRVFASHAYSRGEWRLDKLTVRYTHKGEEISKEVPLGSYGYNSVDLGLLDDIQDGSKLTLEFTVNDSAPDRQFGRDGYTSTDTFTKEQLVEAFNTIKQNKDNDAEISYAILQRGGERFKRPYVHLKDMPSDGAPIYLN